MFDTLHLEIPSGVQLTNSMVRSMGYLRGENRKKFEKAGRDYHYVRDMRYMDIPALWHSVNARSPSAGDKFEFIGAGGMTVGEMAGYLHEIFHFDVDDANIMRLDCTADIDGAWVPWCRKNVRVSGKQCVQHETPPKGDSAVREYARAEAETIYWGRGSRQTMVYDKTGQRRYLLQRRRSQYTKDERSHMSLEQHFFEEYGYSIFQPVTRFERRMGARETKTAFHIEKFGEIGKAAFRNPFTKMDFPEQVEAKREPVRLTHDEKFVVDAVRQLIAEDGWTNARNEMKRVYGGKDRTQFYRKLARLEPYLFPTGERLTRVEVLHSFIASTLVQLAA